MINKDYFSDNEREIVKNFYIYSRKLNECDILELIWDKCKIKAHFITDYNDYDEKTKEDYQSFNFKCISFSGESPFENYIPKKDDAFDVCYKNFPKEIWLNNKKIN